MTRNAYALLIAGDHLHHRGAPTPNAELSLNSVQADLRARFQSPQIVYLARAPTVQSVNKAFKSMQPQIRSGDLFVVMFAGHGDEPTQTRPSQSWYLTAGEYYPDTELADRLLGFANGVDAVVISDCCYGGGFFRVGPSLLPGRSQRQIDHMLLRSQSRALARTLGAQWNGARRNSPMVCISAASKDDMVAQANLTALATKTARAARMRQSYSQLNAIFSSFTPTGGTFHVDARPGSRMADIVLHT